MDKTMEPAWGNWSSCSKTNAKNLDKRKTGIKMIWIAKERKELNFRIS
jgi:hypothetical protein